MYGASNIPGIPGQMQAAWSASAAKGHEVSAQESNEQKEANRAKANMVSRAKMLEAMQKAQASKKGMMA